MRALSVTCTTDQKSGDKYDRTRKTPTDFAVLSYNVHECCQEEEGKRPNYRALFIDHAIKVAEEKHCPRREESIVGRRILLATVSQDHEDEHGLQKKCRQDDEQRQHIDDDRPKHLHRGRQWEWSK